MNLIPNESVGIFILGNVIEDYKQMSYDVVHHEGEGYCYNSCKFDNLGVVLWSDDDKKINNIRCTKYCYWQGKNLIKMPFDEFLSKYGIKPYKSEMIYTLVGENRGQNQMVYDFDNYGLQIWVWRKKIVTVIVYQQIPL